jgi:ABC-type transport system involved in multi-copper enzyme maturation permease subunit
MMNIILLTQNAFRAILHGRAMYLWLLAGLLLAIRLLPLILVPNPQLPSGIRVPPEMQERMAEAIKNRRPNAMADGMNQWGVLCIAFGILVGATAIPTEINTKTLMTVLARPVRRWQVLFGKWIAIQLFSIVSLLIGRLIFAAAAGYFEVTFSSVVWSALLEVMVGVMLYSAIAIALSTVLSPTLAGAIAVILAFIPGLIVFLIADTDTFRHAIGIVADYVVPPGYSNLFGFSVRAGGADAIDYSEHFKTMLQNMGYAAVFFALGCLVFTKREIRLG